MTLTPDRTEEIPNLLQEVDFDAVPNGALVIRQEETPLPTTPTSEIVRWLEASEQRYLRELRQRQIEAVLGTPISITQAAPPSGEDMLRTLREMNPLRYVAYQEERYYSPYGERDWYCYCSPTRGQFFERERYMDRMPAMQAAPNPIFQMPTLSEEELVHTCSPDRNGVCVWANCPNTNTHLSGTAMDINTGRGLDTVWELVDEANYAIEATTWMPEPEPEPSKELAVIPKVEVMDVIPEPKRSRVPQLAVIGAAVMVAVAFVADIATAVLHY